MTDVYIERTLQELHIKRRFKGYDFLKAAAAMVLEDEDRMHKLKRDVYLPVSIQCGCKWSHVERDIRTVSKNIWEEYRDTLREISGCDYDAPPSPSDLIEIIVNHVKRTWLQPQC